MMLRRYSKNGLLLTEQFEQCRLVAYQDEGGVWTIGWGHTRDVYPGQICTRSQADEWLLADMHTAEAGVNRLVYRPLAQEQFDALVDFVFNIGVGNFAMSTCLKLLNAGDYSRAADELLKWKYVNKHECAGLLRRRIAEQGEFFSSDAEGAV